MILLNFILKTNLITKPHGPKLTEGERFNYNYVITFVVDFN